MVDGEVVGECGPGLLVLVAAGKKSTIKQAQWLADRVAKLRIFNDSEGKMNLALSDLAVTGKAQILAISQFTLYGDARKSRRPSFVEAAGYDDGRNLFEAFVSACGELGIQTETGVFGASMQVELLNDGPVTLILDAPANK